MPLLITVVLSVLAAFVLAVIVLYNNLIRAKIKVRQAWAQVDTQLQRRHDLIPNLVATVQGYAGHERAVLDEVVRARSLALATRDPLAREGAEDALGASLGRLLMVAERYPALRADERFAHLATELRGTEDRIAFARGFANDRVARYRKSTDTFPGVLIAQLFRFPREELFALEHERARRAPVVDL